MSTEVRRLRNDAEWEQYLEAAIYAFNAARDGSMLERYRKGYQRDWCLAAFDGGRLVAGLTLIPFEQYMLGARIPLGGVATVASLPERRREGYVGALLRAALSDMKDAGQPLSGLYTPHYSLYRRFGWEIATRMISYSFAPKAVETRMARPGGAFRRVGPEDWRQLAAMREPHASARNGALLRDEMWWRGHVFTDFFKGARDVVVWSDDTGRDRGYAVYEQQHRQSGGPWGETVLRVIDWLALDGEAYAALLSYLLSHDLVDSIVMVVSEDEPVPAAFVEPAHIKQPPGVWNGMLLRVVDAQAAFAARPASVVGSGCAVTMRIQDGTAPWNDGIWRLAAAEGRISLERASSNPQLELDAVALGPLYNGSLNPREAARVGLLRAHDDVALDDLQAMLQMPFAPHTPDDF